MQNIVTGNDFTLIVDARRQETASQRFDLRVLERLEIYLVMAGRAKILQSYTLDELGRAVIEVGGDALPVGVWGVELVGTYQMANVRSTNAKAFKIVDGLNQLGLSGDGIEIVVEVNVLSNAEATRPYVDAAIADHDADVTSHSDIRTALAQKVSDIKVDGISIVDGNKVANLDSDDFGKVDDVKVNGVSVVSNKEAAITMPTKVSDLANDSQFTTKSYVDGEIAQAGHVDDVQVNGTSVVSGKVASVTMPTKVSDLTNDADYRNATQVQSAINTAIEANLINDGVGTVDNTTGTPSVDIVKQGTTLHFDFHNIKGAQGDRGEKGEKGETGAQGATSVYDQTTQDFLTTLETTTGQSQTKTMTQKAITDEFMKDRIWSEISITIPSPTSSSDLRNISRVTLKWEGQTSNRSGVRFAITSGNTYKIVGNASYEGRYAWLKNNTNTSGTTPYWCDGCSLETLLAGETKYITAPDDANYIYIEKKSTGNFTGPSFFGAVEYTRDVISKDKEQIAMLGGSLYERKILPTTATDVQLRYILYEVGTWKANTSALSGIVVEVEPLATYKITPPSGNYVRYAWLKGNDRTIDATPQYSDGCTTSWGPQGETIYITAPSDAHYLYLHRHGYTAELPIYFGRYIASDNGIDENTLMLVKHATTKAPSNDWLPNFSLLHYSDIHGTQMAAENIKRAAVALDQYIQGVLNTGDVVNATTDGAFGGATFYPNSGLQEVSLFTLGNHDDLISVDSGARKDKAWSHDLYFPASIITALGITMPTGYDDSSSPNYKACYWHKDYTAHKVRLIGLDCRNKCDGVVDPETGAVTTQGNTGNEQEAWLAARLAETLPDSGNAAAGYTVIIAGHYPLDDYDVVTNGENKAWDDDTHEWVCNHEDTGGRIINDKTGKVSNWHRYTATQYISLPSMRWANADGHNNIAEIIKYYMEEGMNFAAYVCGHTHNNLFFYPTRYPDILNVCIDMAGNLRDMMYADNGTMGGYIANVISFNTIGKRINIIRLGVKSDVYLTPINYLCYDYANRKVIQEG